MSGIQTETKPGDAVAGGGAVLSPWSPLSELKFNVEGVTLCGGHCAGCMLDAPERQTGSTLDDRFLDALAVSVQTLREAERADFPNHRLETIVNFGQGDHLLLPHEELVRRLDWMERLREGDNPATCFMTVSGIAKPALFARRIEDLHRESVQRKQLLNLDIVIDPVLVQATSGARAMLEANVATVLRVFGGCDLHVNVGPDTIDALAPEELLEFCGKHAINSLTVNLMPTRASAARFAARWPQIMEWMRTLSVRWLAYGEVLTFSGGLAVLLALMATDVKTHGAQMADGMRQRRVREFYITPDGAAYLAQTGFGDTAFTSRSGFTPIGSVHEPQRLLLLARTGFGLAAQRSGVSIRGEHAACAGCRHRETCEISGMRNALAVLGEVGVGCGEAAGSCPIGMTPIFDVYARAYAAGEHLTLPCLCQIGQPHAQAELSLEKTYSNQHRDHLDRVCFWARKE